MKLIVGLGNPGKEYLRTRHNAGFIVLDELQTTFELPSFTLDRKSNAEISKGTLDKKRVVLVKPQTYMNNSGVAVRALLNYYKLTPADLIVIHDDKDVPIGNFRMQSNRGAAGHNGIKSLFEHLGTQDFLRLRVGVAPVDRTIHDTANFVLNNFSPEEQQVLATTTGNILKEVHRLVTEL